MFGGPGQDNSGQDNNVQSKHRQKCKTDSLVAKFQAPAGKS